MFSIIRLFLPSKVGELGPLLLHEAPLPGFMVHFFFPGFAVQVQIHKPMSGQASELSNLTWTLSCRLYSNVHISYSPASTDKINAPFKVLTGLMAKQAQTTTLSDVRISLLFPPRSLQAGD